MITVTLAYAADERMAMPLAASIASATLNFQAPDSALNVVVVDGGLSATSVSRLFPAEFDVARFCFRLVGAPPLSMQGINPGRYGAAALYRLALPQLLPDCRRAIYLDADTIVEHDLRELWDETAGAAPLWARQDWMFPVMSHPYLRARCHGLGMHADDPYFNSGVLVLDLDEWRRRQYARHVLDFIRTYGERCPWLDQDALNAVFRGSWKPLGSRWNRYPAELEQGEPTGIIHYIGEDGKPWLNGPDTTLASRRFRHYLRVTAWSGTFGP